MTNTLLRLKYTGTTLAVLALFWMPFIEGAWHGCIKAKYREWLHALRYSFYIARTGDVWYAPSSPSAPPGDPS